MVSPSDRALWVCRKACGPTPHRYFEQNKKVQRHWKTHCVGEMARLAFESRCSPLDSILEVF